MGAEVGLWGLRGHGKITYGQTVRFGEEWIFSSKFPSSHNHGSVKNGCIPNIGSLPFKYSHFPLNHDYGGKSKTITMWNFRTSLFFSLVFGKDGPALGRWGQVAKKSARSLVGGIDMYRLRLLICLIWYIWWVVVKFREFLFLDDGGAYDFAAGGDGDGDGHEYDSSHHGFQG